MVAVDYPGEMDIEKGRNSYEEYGKIAYQLKKLANLYDFQINLGFLFRLYSVLNLVNLQIYKLFLDLIFCVEVVYHI